MDKTMRMTVKTTAFAALLLFAGSGPAAAAVLPSENASIAETGDGYRVTGSFDIRSSETNVWQTLADYGSLANILSDLTESSVVDRSGNRITVRQVISSKFLVFSRTVNLLIDVREHPFREIDFSEISGCPFAVYKGSWTLEREAGGVRVTYRLRVSKGALAPVIFEKRLFLERARKTLSEMKREIDRRIALKVSRAPSR